MLIVFPPCLERSVKGGGGRELGSPLGCFPVAVKYKKVTGLFNLPVVSNPFHDWLQRRKGASPSQMVTMIVGFVIVRFLLVGGHHLND